MTAATTISPPRARPRGDAWGSGGTARAVAPILLGVTVVAVWQLIAGSGLVEAYLLPSPAAIGAEIAEFWPSMVSAGAITGLNALVGLVAGSVIGIVAALLASTRRSLDGMLAPIVAALAVIPIVALAPVLNTMFGADSQTGRQLIAALAAFVPVFLNTARGSGRRSPCTATSCAATPRATRRSCARSLCARRRPSPSRASASRPPSP